MGNDGLRGGGDDDTLTGGGGNDTFNYIGDDGNDVITDFVMADDTVDLDRLFDALGAGTPDARAALVSLDDTSNQGVGGAAIDTVLTISGAGGFSITFQDVTPSDPTPGVPGLTVAELLALGIDVGS